MPYRNTNQTLQKRVRQCSAYLRARGNLVKKWLIPWSGTHPIPFLKGMRDASLRVWDQGLYALLINLVLSSQMGSQPDFFNRQFPPERKKDHRESNAG